MSTKVLDIFDPLTANWFKKTLGTPTAVQEEAWPAIASGSHTLVSAPTGTGKTLSAFLVFIDRLKAEARAGTLKQELQLIYVSPLKALAGDIRENLRRPLNGIIQEEMDAANISFERNLKNNPFDIEIAIRTGDTTQSERKKMIKTPPHILITTPESLFLLLTSKSGQTILSTAKAIIIDELHAMIDSKRGSHLMLSIARLDNLCKRPLQRIGLSATIEPLDKAGEYLSPDNVTIVAPKMHKEVKLVVTSPISERKTMLKDPVWQELAATVYEYCNETRSVIAFVEGRRYAEKLAYYVNQIGGDGFARTHHGSLSKEQRFAVEQSLRDGSLRLLCATSSMELGIDVGDIDQVLQVGCPRSISSTMQRLGRAGHNPGRVSVMHIFPRAAAEGLYCGLTAEVARRGGVEYSNPPRLCLDILAQHLVSMAVNGGFHVEEVMEILKRACPFKDVTIDDVRDVLRMLAGDYEHERDLPVRPRLLYDRIHDYAEGDTYSRMLAVSAGGTIPDRGLYSVKTENGVKLGELDEEFIFESQVGDKFLLGTFAWQISSIQKDVVVVTQTNSASARMPFWKGEIKGRRLRTGIAFGSIMRTLYEASESGKLYEELNRLGLDEAASRGAEDYIKRQLKATEVLPDDRTILIEHFKDETGNHQLMVHSCFGRQVNAPLAILTREITNKKTGININFVEDDDGFLLFPYGDCVMPDGVLYDISPESAKEVLEAILPSTPLFNMTFRYNAARALMMGVRNHRRQPLWVQRMRSTQMLDSLVSFNNHPLIRETKRECLNDYWDIPGVEYVLNNIRSGNIQVREMYLETPSPMSLLLRQQTEASMMYEYAPTTFAIQKETEEALKQVQAIPPSTDVLAKISERTRLPEDEKQLHSLLMIEGDLIAGELEVPIDWLELLAKRNQAKYIEPGLWIAAEQEEEYLSALNGTDKEAMLHVVRRFLRYRGAGSADLIAERYFWDESIAGNILEELCELENAVESDGLYYHADIYNKAQKETIRSRRRQIKTLPSETYAALLANHLSITAPAAEQLERCLKLFRDQPYPPALWESVLLPSRVKNYRPELLDNLLTQGSIFWNLSPEKGLSFHQYDDMDWDVPLTDTADNLEGNEKIVYEALLKRGASFVQSLSGLLDGVSPYDTLLKLVENGLIHADSFLPIRLLLNNKKIEKSTDRQRISAKVKAGNSGRWEVTRPLAGINLEEQLERTFDRVIILCKETCGELSWGKALEILRIWEYTGRARRGYFIEGLSGIQFIREKDFAGTMLELEQPREQIIWLPAADMAQQWGKSLPHWKDRAFLNVAGTAVALYKGIPAAVFERQGKVLRVFEESVLEEVIKVFSKDFLGKRLFPNINRLIVKEYPKEAAEALSQAGFKREMLDYVLYR